MTTYLVDTSAWFVSPRAPAAKQRLSELAPRFLAATSPPVMFEVLTAARDAREMRTRRRQLEALEMLDVESSDWSRALETYELLAERGPLHHRQVARTDILIAAIAERHRVTVLHYDKDFDLIADITGQSTEWIAPRGSL